MTTHKRLRTTVSALVISGAFVGTAVLEFRSEASSPLPNGPYIALGDSYTAGSQIPGQTGRPASCSRSDHNYPSRTADELHLAPCDFRDMSCSGAITDLTQAQDTGSGTNPAQLSALSAHARLVTLGIGGNDMGFRGLITGWVKAGALDYALGFGRTTPDAAPCRARRSGAGSDEVAQKIDALRPRLAAALIEIHHRAPLARVFVVGYPGIFLLDGTDCARALMLTPGDVTYLREREKYLDDVLRETAKNDGAGYVDTCTPSVGHDACSPEGTRWIEPLLPAAPAMPVHPNALGENGVGMAVLAAVRK